MIFYNLFPKDSRRVYRIVAITVWFFSSTNTRSVAYTNSFIQNTVPTMRFCDNIIHLVVNNRYAIITCTRKNNSYKSTDDIGMMLVIRKKIKK